MKIAHRFAQLISMLAMAVLAMSATAGTVTYYHNDIAGSPVAATNEQGQVIWRESFRPYGERTVNSPAAVDNKIWFTSRRQDAETGLVYMGARYYDPVIGRFISIDPLGFNEKNLHSFNRYGYANNNPYRYFDPDGREPGNLYQRGYVPPPVQIFPEPGLVKVLPEAVFIPGIAGVAARMAAGREAPVPAETTTLYRAVSQAELKQIQATGQFETSASSAGGKYFAESAADAAKWGNKLEGSGNFSVVEARFSKSAADSFKRWEKLDGIGPARFGEMNQINAANPTIKVLP